MLSWPPATLGLGCRGTAVRRCWPAGLRRNGALVPRQQVGARGAGGAEWGATASAPRWCRRQRHAPGRAAPPGKCRLLAFCCCPPGRAAEWPVRRGTAKSTSQRRRTAGEQGGRPAWSKQAPRAAGGRTPRPDRTCEFMIASGTEPGRQRDEKRGRADSRCSPARLLAKPCYRPPPRGCACWL